MPYTTSFFSPTYFPTRYIPKRTTRTVTVFATPPLNPTDISQTTLTLLTGSAALAAAITLTDPERRRKQQSDSVGGSDKEVVKEYFNKEGFERWRKIYGETEEVNQVQRDIREGHAKTVEIVVKMLVEDEAVDGVRVCDAGCGTGCLAIPLAELGARVYGADISEAMVAEARKQAEERLGEGSVMPEFEVKDLESLEGKYDTVVCLDVLIHYPQSKADRMISHLASLAENRLILSFAPKTFYYDLLKRVGELFPGPSKATRAYLHAEADIERALKKVGWRIRKRGLITSQFYFARLVEAVPA